MGEAKRRRQARLKEYDCAVEEAPVLVGHLRITILDDDDVGCSVYFEVDRVVELLDRAGKLTRSGRTLTEIATDPCRWARLRDGAFDRAREQSQREAVGLLMLWCVMHGPNGPGVRRQVSTLIAERGHAVIVTRRDRKTQRVGTTVGEDPAIISADMVRKLGGHLQDGAFVSVSASEPRREDA
jgi:hypothetical protein